MNVLHNIRMLLVIVATSYLTLGLFAQGEAKRWWWVYGILIFMLSIANLIYGRRRHSGRRNTTTT